MRRLLCLIVLLALPGLTGAQDFIKYYPAPVAGTSGGGATFTSQVLLSNGTALLPAMSFAAEPNLGIWRYGNYKMVISLNGTSAIGIGGVEAPVHKILLRGDIGGIAFRSDGNIASADLPDLILIEDGANTFAQKNGNNDQRNRLYATNGGYWEHGTASELLTIAAAATTDTTANLLPVDAVIESVTVRVTTLIPTAVTFTVGDATTAARFATGVAVAAGTTAVGLLHRNPDVAAAAGPVQSAAAKVRITPNAQPAAATGVVRIQVFYSKWVAPTT
jgi:hypothetical protein